MVEHDFSRSRVIAIARGMEYEELSKLVRALTDGGIRLAEVTLNSKDALNSIAKLKERYQNEIHIGAGTVLNLQAVKDAISAGAEFIVTPNMNKQVISYCAERNILITPGAFTPTEIVEAVQSGARYVKVFPVRALGAGYIKDILAPLSDVKLIAVGGVDDMNAEQYMRAGTYGLGVGGNLCRLPEDGDFSRITEYARKLVQTCRAFGEKG